MNLDKHEVKDAIRAKIIELAKALDMDASGIAELDIIPATGYLDSTAVLELVVWYEKKYGLELAQEDINIDNLGSIESMANFLLARKGALPAHR